MLEHKNNHLIPLSAPTDRPRCTLFGETYESRAAHGNKKAAEQDRAMAQRSQDVRKRDSSTVSHGHELIVS